MRTMHKGEIAVKIKYGNGKFQPPDTYLRYINMIADSPCYSGLSHIREDSGKINWQCSSGKTTSFFKYFQERLNWWIETADRLGIPGIGNSDDRLTIAARLIHPTRKKVCLVCGRERHIGYMYINANCAKRWNKLVRGDPFHTAMPADEAAEVLVSELGGKKARDIVSADFPEKTADIGLFDSGEYERFFAKTQQIRSAKLSPGFMGDCPHRLDGLHDYCIFCRKRSDPGRSDENMSTYIHDRRAFMWWTEGDWKAADALYHSAGAGRCVNCGRRVKKISPDHVGPLSCGFKQLPFFEPLCPRCNSAKNRRFTFKNVTVLMEYEIRNHVSAAGWQVRRLWDETKEAVCSDADAKILSNYMRAMQDYYLRILGHAAATGHYGVLTALLHPEYAHFAVRFRGLDPSELTYESCVKVPSRTNGSRSLAARSVRIAFEELYEYCSKPAARRRSILLKTVRSFLKADIPEVDSCFSRYQFRETDLSLGQILRSCSISTELKDRAVQEIIESDAFRRRGQEHMDEIEFLHELLNRRGRQLAALCLAEIEGNRT